MGVGWYSLPPITPIGTNHESTNMTDATQLIDLAYVLLAGLVLSAGYVRYFVLGD